LAARTIAEHPFRGVKRQFGCLEVRYGEAVEECRVIVMLYALSNLWLARKRLLTLLA
jgi:IS5 family transposase